MSAAADRREETDPRRAPKRMMGRMDDAPIDDRQMDFLRWDAQRIQQIADRCIVFEIGIERFSRRCAVPIPDERREQAHRDPHFSASLPESEIPGGPDRLGSKSHLYRSCMSSGKSPSRSPSETGVSRSA